MVLSYKRGQWYSSSTSINLDYSKVPFKTFVNAVRIVLWRCQARYSYKYHEPGYKQYWDGKSSHQPNYSAWNEVTIAAHLMEKYMGDQNAYALDVYRSFGLVLVSTDKTVWGKVTINSQNWVTEVDDEEPHYTLEPEKGHTVDITKAQYETLRLIVKDPSNLTDWSAEMALVTMGLFDNDADIKFKGAIF